MKKFILTVLLMVATILSCLAVPRGLYSDNRGRNRVLVSDNGTEIYFLDNNGNVTKTLQVIQENSDGSFVTKDLSNGIVRNDNAYWYENGECYLNLAQKASTLTHE